MARLVHVLLAFVCMVALATGCGSDGTASSQSGDVVSSDEDPGADRYDTGSQSDSGAADNNDYAITEDELADAREEAYEEGRQEGYDAGYEEGQEDAKSDEWDSPDGP